ncbi:MAG: 30S ribosomal protein S3 [Candidatus Woesearchaeota archaeon]
MIETKFIQEIVKEFQITEFIAESLNNVGFSHAEVHKTPLGEKIIIYASRPGLIVGRKGENIQKLTKIMKSKFRLENPQIEIVEVERPLLNPIIVAERIASSLERFGLSKFKGIGHKMLTDVMGDGAQGIEILISGKIPSSRAKRWRFYQGYLKKSGDLAVSGVKKAYAQAKLKTGVVGIQVRIMPPDLQLPDKVIEKTEITVADVEVKSKKSKKKTVKKTKSTDKSNVKKKNKEVESVPVVDSEKSDVVPDVPEGSDAVEKTNIENKDLKEN